MFESEKKMIDKFIRERFDPDTFYLNPLDPEDGKQANELQIELIKKYRKIENAYGIQVNKNIIRPLIEFSLKTHSVDLIVIAPDLEKLKVVLDKYNAAPLRNIMKMYQKFTSVVEGFEHYYLFWY